MMNHKHLRHSLPLRCSEAWVLVHSCNPSTPEPEAGASWEQNLGVQGSCQQHQGHWALPRAVKRHQGIPSSCEPEPGSGSSESTESNSWFAQAVKTNLPKVRQSCDPRSWERAAGAVGRCPPVLPPSRWTEATAPTSSPAQEPCNCARLGRARRGPAEP